MTWWPWQNTGHVYVKHGHSCISSLSTLRSKRQGKPLRHGTKFTIPTIWIHGSDHEFKILSMDSRHVHAYLCISSDRRKSTILAKRAWSSLNAGDSKSIVVHLNKKAASVINWTLQVSSAPSSKVPGKLVLCLHHEMQ